MKLYSGPLSLFSRKVEIALGEKNLTYEREMVPFSQAAGYTPKHPAVLAANPKGQVPVLIDGELTLFDSTLIMEYLDDAYPAVPLRPAEPRERARCRLIELAADEIVLPPLVKLMHRTVPPASDPAVRARQAAEAAAGEQALAGHYARMADHLGAGGRYLCGAFSVADIALFMTLLFANRLGGPPLDATPALAAWYARTAERPVVAGIAAEIAEADRRLSHRG